MNSPDIRDMEMEMVNWIEGVLPVRDPRRTIAKMCGEVGELLEAQCLGTKADIADEAADVLILLIDVCHLNGVDLTEAFHRKLEINKQRSWVAASGSLQHIEDNK